MIGRGPGAAYAACCSVAFRKLASELFFERAFYRGPLNFPLVKYLPVARLLLIDSTPSTAIGRSPAANRRPGSLLTPIDPSRADCPAVEGQRSRHRCRARPLLTIQRVGGESIWVLFLTEDSGVPPATMFVDPPTAFFTCHIIFRWLPDRAPSRTTHYRQINFDDYEQTFVG
jgi:hypothetical protein